MSWICRSLLGPYPPSPREVVGASGSSATTIMLLEDNETFKIHNLCWYSKVFTNMNSRLARNLKIEISENITLQCADLEQLTRIV